MQAPDWAHSIRMVHYDYFSPLPPSPNSWDTVVAALAAQVREH